MKTLNTLSNIEKGLLLFDLFIDEIPGFIAFANELTLSIVEDPEKLKNKPFDQLHTTPFWMELVLKAKERIEKHSKELEVSGHFFSIQLFDEYDFMYSGYCLHQFLLTEECERKFRLGIRMLFF